MKKIGLLLMIIFTVYGCETEEEDTRNAEFSCKIDGAIWNADEINFSGQRTVKSSL